MDHWSTKYLGKPWKEDYDCYAFFLEVQKKEFGLKEQLDFVPPNYSNRKKAIEFVENSEDVKTHWKDICIPTEGDAVLFGASNHSFHIGIWVNIDGESGVIHCQIGHGVVFTSRRNIIERGVKIASYLRCKK